MKYLKKVIDYNNDKKKLLVISGLHGEEMNAVYCSMIVKKMVEQKPLSDKYGSITFLIGLNEYGIRNNTRETGDTYNKKDLNRIFFEEVDYKKLLLEEIEKNDIVIDIHNSPDIKNMVLLEFDDYVEGFRKFFKENEVETMVWIRGTPTVKNKVNSYENKIGITVELNHMNSTSSKFIDENVVFLKKVIDIAHGCPKVVGDKDEAILCQDFLTKVEGVIKWTDKLIFQKDEIIAEILDYDCNVLQTFRAPYRCSVLCKNKRLFITSGDFIFSLNNLEV